MRLAWAPDTVTPEASPAWGGADCELRMTLRYNSSRLASTYYVPDGARVPSFNAHSTERNPSSPVSGWTCCPQKGEEGPKLPSREVAEPGHNLGLTQSRCLFTTPHFPFAATKWSPRLARRLGRIQTAGPALPGLCGDSSGTFSAAMSAWGGGQGG